MEKLKVKHDHTLTDIIKVGIFALFLILPILVFLPNCLYYGFNEHAVTNNQEIEVIETLNINFNQLGKARANTQYGIEVSYSEQTGQYTFTGTGQNNGPYVMRYPNSADSRLGFYLLNNHKYYVRSNIGYNDGLRIQAVVDETYRSPQVNTIFYYTITQTSFANVWFYARTGANIDIENVYINVFDLTQMYGIGNEPTKEVFDSTFTDLYYPYTLNQEETIQVATGETKTYTDIASNITNAWQNTWESPMLNWTNNNAFSFTINAFTNIFRITPESKMANYLTYLLVITCIYLVFDIVLTLTTKLTHLINEK